jgi:hypothetical protein
MDSLSVFQERVALAAFQEFQKNSVKMPHFPTFTTEVLEINVQQFSGDCALKPQLTRTYRT